MTPRDTSDTAAWDATPPHEKPRPAALPARISRYVVRRRLGGGGFGQVYLCYDERAEREVAVKVPRPERLGAGEARTAFLREARNVARLDHRHIVPLYDIGDEDGLCFLVYKYIEGQSLYERMQQGPVPLPLAIATVAQTADALHHAHGKNLFHRDVKPGNILLDRAELAYVTDFGLALPEEDMLQQRGRQSGTYPYISPEQLRGESHRIDGRTDVYSLGIVLYELLTGRRAFSGNRSDLMEQILHGEVRPPRQIRDALPRELERICLKAISRQMSQRHATAQDLAEDLRAAAGSLTPALAAATMPSTIDRNAPTPESRHTPSSRAHAPIVPKGLRSFGPEDREFFLELLPGPRDRHGVPDPLCFWQARIENRDADQTFAVGLLYGPSGCGKSSLVRAGLLPRLDPGILPVYVEAAPQATEAQLTKGVRRACPGVAGDTALPQMLPQMLAQLRGGRHLPPGGKLLIVIDQFEQWLQAHGHDLEATDLAAALRHADGTHLQFLLLVRDDFWTRTSRLFEFLEINLDRDRNARVVDLFDAQHARRVLAMFGQAYDRLPVHMHALTADHRAFLDHAATQLSQDSRVIPVRLSLFAELMKDRPWTAAALVEVGGAEGVGLRFLEETFAARTARPDLRALEKPARALLEALLPEHGGDIKGRMRSAAELAATCGLAETSSRFARLLEILDRELHIITPAEAEPAEAEPAEAEPAEAEPKANATAAAGYQLTHDYLVPSLRQWLTLQQRKTLRGRTMIRLAERSALWQAKPENRHLPSPVEWARIRLLTRRRDWSAGQRRMMHAADRYWAMYGVVLAGVILLLGWGVSHFVDRQAADALRESLQSAAIGEVPGIVDRMTPHRRRLEPLLRDAHAAEPDLARKLRLRLALVRWDADQVNPLYERLLEAEPQDFAVIRGALAPHRQQLTDRLWQELADPERDSARRFRAACALIEYAREDLRWMQCAAHVVDGLVAENPLALSHWKTALEPVKDRLLVALAASLENAKWGPADRRAIIDFYRHFSEGNANAFAPFEDRVSAADAAGAGVEQEKRKATVAAALAALGRGEKVWPLLVHTPAPTLRSCLIERLASCGVDPRVLKKRLDEEKDVSARRALILALGGYPRDRLPEMIPVLLDLYEHHPDPGIHGAAAWTLRTWKQTDRLSKIDEKLAGRPRDGRGWYVNRQHQTLTIIAGDRLKALGAKEAPQAPGQGLAIGVTEVTVQQFLAFRKDHKVDASVATTPDSPVNMVSWYDMAAYCNWLSKEDDIEEAQWCFRKSKDGKLDFVPDYRTRKGYRLPTEAEWEFACRAGAKTAWHFGEADDELLSQYARWAKNSYGSGDHQASPVASHRPNDRGLFDMHGNAMEMCQESSRPQAGLFSGDLESALRGGSYGSTPRALACDESFFLGRSMPRPTIGFRVCRTTVE